MSSAVEYRDAIPTLIDVGDRVILATATNRGPDVLGTVIERDPYPDRNVLVRVLHEDGITRWHRRDSLRALGYRMAASDLAADLELMGRARLVQLDGTAASR